MSSLSELRQRGWRKHLRSLEPPSSDITPLGAMIDRRNFIAMLVTAGGSVLGHAGSAHACKPVPETHWLTNESLTPQSKATSYNNYLEFSPDKKAVRFLAQDLTLFPWQIEITGEVDNPILIDVGDIASKFSIEQRIYRFRCVEGWSMVVPWGGIPLCSLLELAKPTSRAKFVEFVSLLRPSEMIGQRRASMEWPYREALTISEATHPLTLFTTEMYGEPLPPQNGGAARIIVPWKYGFKSPKAVSKIVLTETRPTTSWNLKAPSEYGFYGNVNPEVPHPRWSQSRENRLGELRKRPTLMLNGYADAVGSLYAGHRPSELY